MAVHIVDGHPDADGVMWDAAPTPAPSQAATASTPSPDESGITWDTQATQNVSNTPAVSNPLAISASDQTITGAGQELNALGAGIGEGVLSTANGAAGILHLPHATMQAREAELQQNNSVNPWLRRTGLTSEALAEFAMGDEALKGLTASEKFLKAAKLTRTIEDSPLLTRLVAGAIRGGTVGATQGGVKTNSVTGAVEGGAAGAAGGVAGEVIPGAINAGKSAVGTVADRVSTALHPGAIQDALQSSIRNVLDETAQEAGVKTAPSTSVRDAAANLADAVKAKGSALYKQLDNAIGGTRFQTFDEQLKNVTRALRNSAGIDPDKDGALIERINDIESSRDKALDMARENGVDPSLIHEANSAWKQGSALEDLNRHIQASTEGIRPEMSGGANRPIPETVNPAKLNPRLDKMINSGRIQQAIGLERTTALRAAANDAHAESETVQAFKKMVGKYAPHVAGGLAGGGALAELYHLFGK